MVDNKRIALEQRKRGFKLFTAAKEFCIGWDAYHAYDFRGALKAFRRLTELEPTNPYSWAYYLFAIEDAGDSTLQQLADVAAQWHECAVKYKYQAQPEMAMMFFSRYMKMLEPVENGGLNPSNSTGLEEV